MPGRKYQSVILSGAEGYRYGFNGKEKDKDINSLTAYDYGFRIYNPGIGKFLSMDPVCARFPWNSPYSYAENDAINYIDLDGLEKASPEIYDMARVLKRIVENKIYSNNCKLKTETDQKVIQNIKVALELDKRTYAKLIVFVYKSRPSNTERAGYIINKSLPYVNQALDMTPAGDIKVVITGENFQGESQSRLGAVGWLALDVFGGEILSNLSKAKNLFKGIKGAGKEAFEEVIRTTENITDALDETHIRAAVNDIFGHPVVINGKTYDHLTEVRNSIRGITNQIKKLNSIISNTKNSSDVIEAATTLRNSLSKQKDEINAVLDRATKSAAEKATR